uniref:Uncharacterized protein n=1 Tax=viral metagenome TaxID=1070528 RepID=A0A6C0I234_9ZZZZ
MVDKCGDNINSNDINDINFEPNIVNANENKYDEMNILIKHLENNWTIKKNIHHCGKNVKEYILKKNSGRDVKMKLIRSNNFETITITSEEECKNSESESSESYENKHRHKWNVKLSDNCLRNFIYNALENEWKLKKTGNKYFCSKRHKGDKRVYEAGYLKEFLLDNFRF